METLRSQIENKVSIFPDFFSRQLNQECTIIERRIATNGCGCEFLLVEFISTGNPLDTKGITVVVIEGNELAEIDRTYVKSIFNR